MTDKTFIDKLALLEIRDRKLLVTRSRGKDTWYIPGGKREAGESDIEALAREIAEELAVRINPETAKLYGVFEAQAHGKPEGTVVRMTCYTARLIGQPMASSEIEEIAWFTFADMDRTSMVDHLIMTDLKKKDLID